MRLEWLRRRGAKRGVARGMVFRSKSWTPAVVVFALVGVLAGCVSDGRSLSMQTGQVPSASPATATPTSVAQNWRSSQSYRLVAQWEPGAVAYGTDPAHRQFGAELVGRITAVNQGPACVLSGPPTIDIVSSTGVVLKVHSDAAGQWCQYSCGAPPQLILAPGAAVLAGMSWQPSYCGPDPGSSVRLRVALPHSTEVTIPVRNLGGAAKPIYSPSCTPALGETRLSVERFGDPQG